MGTKSNVYGEGNYEATRQYNAATKKFIEAGKVDEAARNAAPRSEEESTQMKQAEAGRAAAREGFAAAGQTRCTKTALNAHSTPKGVAMLRYAAIFFVIALIAALFGFGGIAVGAAEIAKILFFVFLVLFVVSLVAGPDPAGPARLA